MHSLCIGAKGTRELNTALQRFGVVSVVIPASWHRPVAQTKRTTCLLRCTINFSNLAAAVLYVRAENKTLFALESHTKAILYVCTHAGIYLWELMHLEDSILYMYTTNI